MLLRKKVALRLIGSGMKKQWSTFKLRKESKKVKVGHIFQTFRIETEETGNRMEVLNQQQRQQQSENNNKKKKTITTVASMIITSALVMATGEMRKAWFWWPRFLPHKARHHWENRAFLEVAALSRSQISSRPEIV